MMFMGDSRRRKLRRLSTKSISQTSTNSKEPTKHHGNTSEETPVVRQRQMSRTSKRGGSKEIAPKVTEPSQDGTKTKTESKEHVNVFAFLERDETNSGTDTEQGDSDVPGLSSSGSSTSSRSENSQPALIQSPYSDLEVHPAGSKAGSLWCDDHRKENSIYSDSGISMLSTSPAEESPVLGYKSRFHNINEGMPNAKHTKIMSGLITTAVPEAPAAHMTHVPSLDLHFMDEPETYYSSSPQVRAQPQTPRTATARNFDPGLQPSWQPSPYQSSPGSIPPPPKAQVQVEKSGYDLLASAIDCRDRRSLTPIYRKFETLNNRILLYLQDEIAEMEDALKRLDAAITEEEGQSMASRARESMYLSQSKWHRQELMCRIFAKVEQYNSALSSYSNLTRNLEPAARSDITAYKDWIAEHAPLLEQEADFLHNAADLMTVSRAEIGNQPLRNNTPIIMVIVALVSTILVFTVVPQLLARLVISAVIGIAGLCTFAPNVLSDMTRIRESKQMIGVYALVMLVLAFVVG